MERPIGLSQGAWTFGRKSALCALSCLWMVRQGSTRAEWDQRPEADQCTTVQVEVMGILLRSESGTCAHVFFKDALNAQIRVPGFAVLDTP